METFPTAKNEYILPRLEELEALISRKEMSIKQSIARANEFRDAWFIRECIKAFKMPELIDFKDQQRQLRRYLPIKKSGRLNGVSQAQIDRAREYPIIELAEKLIPSMRKSGCNAKALCLFHQEKTPSFQLYSRGNNFHCFGCGAHGDVIALTQKILSYDFMEAVRYLAPV